jgi:hypothetical protein
MTAVEAVRAETVAAFREAFCPAYGLAEHTVSVSVRGRAMARVERASLAAHRRGHAGRLRGRRRGCTHARRLPPAVAGRARSIPDRPGVHASLGEHRLEVLAHDAMVGRFLGLTALVPPRARPVGREHAPRGLHGPCRTDAQVHWSERVRARVRALPDRFAYPFDVASPKRCRS